MQSLPAYARRVPAYAGACRRVPGVCFQRLFSAFSLGRQHRVRETAAALGMVEGGIDLLQGESTNLYLREGKQAGRYHVEQLGRRPSGIRHVALDRDLVQHDVHVWKTEIRLDASHEHRGASAA